MRMCDAFRGMCRIMGISRGLWGALRGMWWAFTGQVEVCVECRGMWGTRED